MEACTRVGYSTIVFVELSVLYSVARSADSQATLRPFVLRAATVTDRTLSELAMWPADTGRPSAATSHYGTDHRIASPTVLRSPGLLAAVLAKHRAALVENGGGSGNFWEEMEFYNEIVDGLVGWLYSGMKRLRRYDDVAGLWPWLHTFGYLMATTNSIGAEQALCRAFHSVVCFSRRETLAYANHSFAAEALFRLYRLASAALPVDPRPNTRRGHHVNRASGDDNGDEIDHGDEDDVDEMGVDDSLASIDHSHLVTQQEYSKTFPALVACRKDIIDDLDHYGMSIDPSLCDYGRKNESELHETDRLTIDERSSLTSRLEAIMANDLESARHWYSVSLAILVSVCTYATVALTLRCVCVIWTAAASENGARSRCCRHHVKHHSVGDQRGSLSFHDGLHQQCSAVCRRKLGSSNIISHQKWPSASLESWHDDVTIATSSATTVTGNGISSAGSMYNADTMTTTMMAEPRANHCHRVVAAATATAIALQTVEHHDDARNGNAITRSNEELVDERCRMSSCGKCTATATAFSAAMPSGTDIGVNDLNSPMGLSSPSDCCDHHRVFVCSRH